MLPAFQPFQLLQLAQGLLRGLVLALHGLAGGTGELGAGESFDLGFEGQLVRRVGQFGVCRHGLKEVDG